MIKTGLATYLLRQQGKQYFPTPNQAKLTHAQFKDHLNQTHLSKMKNTGVKDLLPLPDLPPGYFRFHILYF